MSDEGLFKRIGAEFERQRREEGICFGQEKTTLLATQEDGFVCRYDPQVQCEFMGKQAVCIGKGHRNKIFTSYVCNYKGKNENACA